MHTNEQTRTISGGERVKVEKDTEIERERSWDRDRVCQTERKKERERAHTTQIETQKLNIK